MNKAYLHNESGKTVIATRYKDGLEDGFENGVPFVLCTAYGLQKIKVTKKDFIILFTLGKDRIYKALYPEDLFIKRFTKIKEKIKC